jgi:hypothetical protein
MMPMPAATHTTAANTDRKEFVTILSQSMRVDQGRVNQCYICDTGVRGSLGAKAVQIEWRFRF